MENNSTTYEIRMQIDLFGRMVWERVFVTDEVKVAEETFHQLSAENIDKKFQMVIVAVHLASD